MFRLRLCRASTNLFNVRKPICTSQTHLNAKAPQDDTFRQIYKFSLIRGFAVFNRLKVYQTVATAVAIPGSVILNLTGVVGTEDVIGTCVVGIETTIFDRISNTQLHSVGISGCLMFYSMGYFTKNVVGILSVNQKESDIKVAYVDFWGKRVDELIPAGDVMTQSDLPVSVTDPVYKRLQRFSNDDTLKIITFGSAIVDEECFNRVVLGVTDT